MLPFHESELFKDKIELIQRTLIEIEFSNETFLDNFFNLFEKIKRLIELTLVGEIVVHNNKHGDKYTRQCWDKVGPCVHTYMANLASQNTVHPVDDRAFSIRELLLMNIPNNFKWSEISEEELNNLPLEEKQQFLKENEANIRECIGEAVPTIIMQKIAKNIKEVLITGKKSQKKGQTRLI